MNPAINEQSASNARTHQVAVLLLILAGIMLRLWFYGDPRHSAATDDTGSYIKSAKAPFLSREFFTGSRLATTNLIYKVFEPSDGYQITRDGSDSTTHRRQQAGFEWITSLQTLLSISGWGFLAFTIANRIKSVVLKYISTALLLLFAFTPQLADWDSLLMSESMMYSLFAMQFAFLISLLFALTDHKSTRAVIHASGFLLTNLLWVFLRDAHVYTEPITLVLLLAPFRRFDQAGRRLVVIASTIITVIFLVGWITAKESPRALATLTHVYENDLLPYPMRAAYLQGLGMPDQVGSLEYQEWFAEHAVSTFIQFLFAHPGYVTYKCTKDFLWSFSDNMQPYFRVPGREDARRYAIQIGDGMHPESITPILAGGLFLIACLQKKWVGGRHSCSPWIWLGFWLFAVASITIFVSILADTYGLIRHTAFSTMAYRLFMWIGLVVGLDLDIGND